MAKRNASQSGSTTVNVSEITPAEFMAAAKPLKIEGTGAVLQPCIFSSGNAGYRLNLAGYAVPIGDKVAAVFGSANLTLVKPNGKPIVPIPTPARPAKVETPALPAPAPVESTES